MTLQALYQEFQRKCALDTKLRSLRKKIDSGSAGFGDTAAYSERISNLLGKTLSKHIEGIPVSEREKVCQWLLQEQYKDTNTLCEVVQTALDEAQGIHLNPVRAEFPAERVEQLAHSLIDPTVKPETIQRRADKPVATVAKSFHDDYIKANAKVRNDLGLKPILKRITSSTACKWCQEVAGRFRFGEQPEDVFRRHDNCDCVIIYDTQVLRGVKTEDGGRSKTWEEVDPQQVMAEGFKATTFSQEEARELQENALSGLTLAGKRDIINTSPMRISMQTFGSPNFDKQRTAGVRKSIRNLTKRVDEHRMKIDSPESIYPNWDTFTDAEKEGYREHWKKEISEFQKQIEQAKAELRKRGETP